MAGVLTGKSWRDFLEKTAHLPPAFEREHAAHDISTPLCINLKSVQGLVVPGASDAEACYQLSVSLYDVAFQQFFGRQWLGPLIEGKRSGAKLHYNQTIYLHTSIASTSVVVVVEVIAIVQEGHQQKRLSCGWGIIRPFKQDAELTDTAYEQKLPIHKSEIYYGTPRALFFMDDPIESNRLLRPITDCQLAYTISTHKALFQIFHLLPENVIVGSRDVIPGIVNNYEDGTDKLHRPKLLRQVPCVINGLVLHLQPNVEKFEDELNELLRDDRANRENTLTDTTQTSIVERRLQVGVHNGWGYVEKPQTVHLDTQCAGQSESRKPPASPTMRRSGKIAMTHKRQGSTGSSITVTNLLLKNRVQINELLEDPMIAVVFTLEYVIGEPLSAQARKMSLSLARSHTRTVCVRWAVWNPLLNPSSQEVLVSMMGGPHRGPDDEFVYRMPFTDMQDENRAKTAGGLISFQCSLDGKDFLPLPTALSPSSNGYHVGSMPSFGSIEDADRFMQESSHSFYKRPPSGKPKSQTAPQLMQISQQVSQQVAMLPQQPGVAFAQPPMMGSVYQQHPMYMTGMGTAGYYPTDIMQAMEPPRSRMTAPDLHELPYTPVHAPILAQGPTARGGQGLSRACYAQLYASGFPPILDRNGDPPEIVDPSTPLPFIMTKEMSDPLQCNEIIFQFLAFSKFYNTILGGSNKTSGTVFFTFQFYRFPQVTTERLLLGKPQTNLTTDPNSMPFILQRIDQDGTVIDGQPGLQIKYYVDPSFLKPGENQLFLQYLYHQTLHLDVWDGDSLLLLGSSAIDLKCLLRGGNEAVQATIEMDVITTEYQDDSQVADNPGGTCVASVSPIMKGKLHFCMANIGQEGDVKRSKLHGEKAMVPVKNCVIVSQTAGNSLYKGGSLNRKDMENASKKLCVSRAQPLIENHEVSTLLLAKDKMMDDEDLMRESNTERRRKLARMEAIRQQEGTDTKPQTIMGYRKEKCERTRALKTIELYRMNMKREGILTMLSSTITSHHTIFPSFGGVEFFEFVLRNPYNVQQTLTIDCTDSELKVITNAREWRHFKQLNHINTHVEEDMFKQETDSDPLQIFLRPKETVNIPFKFQSFKADNSVQPQGPVDPFKKPRNMNKTQDKIEALESRVVKVVFTSDEGKPVSVLVLKVEPQPHVVDQTFRFHHPEQAFLKKSIRLQQVPTLPGSQIGGSSGMSQVFVRCSDQNVICDSRATQPGEPHDVFIKCALGLSPQIKRFHVAIYLDPLLSKPIQIWQIFTHAMKRVDVMSIEGQTSHFSLLLRGTQSTRLSRCFSSHPEEMSLSPCDQFLLAAGAVHELSVAVRPMRPGNHFYYLNVVDLDCHQLIHAWIVCVACRAPIISRAYELDLPVGGGKGSSKRITYQNPYPVTKSFQLRTDRGDLLQFKDTRIEVGGGAQYTIRLSFVPVMQPGVAEIMVFINDEDDKNEETFRVTANYKHFT
ncbi:nephrocystin-4-like [Gigantopelta aegis]|uniref:nephrocystin-4-like n=1 Tax=Gigantopelta aegis TaxID=1735272 RepID=UPI001B889FA7|nr:nephrocystin-4-like [Gigantopelta aegis]